MSDIDDIEAIEDGLSELNNIKEESRFIDRNHERIEDEICEHETTERAQESIAIEKEQAARKYLRDIINNPHEATTRLNLRRLEEDNRQRLFIARCNIRQLTENTQDLKEQNRQKSISRIQLRSLEKKLDEDEDGSLIEAKEELKTNLEEGEEESETDALNLEKDARDDLVDLKNDIRDKEENANYYLSKIILDKDAEESIARLRIRRLEDDTQDLKKRNRQIKEELEDKLETKKIVPPPPAYCTMGCTRFLWSFWK